MELPHIEMDMDFSEAVTACDKLLTQKGHDYTQGRSEVKSDHKGRLINFYKNAEKNGLTPYQILNVYMGKHLDAIDTFIKSGGLRTESEPIEGRICDAINYMLLLYKMVKYEQRQANHIQSQLTAAEGVRA